MVFPDYFAIVGAGDVFDWHNQGYFVGEAFLVFGVVFYGKCVVDIATIWFGGVDNIYAINAVFDDFTGHFMKLLQGVSVLAPVLVKESLCCFLWSEFVT